ncbi:MAG: TatD family hydrolase [Myxococcales bacterium]|nr:TatD family hydrolase [Myxococcales bacterium]
MIDSHCHLDVDAFADDRAVVVARAVAAGVRGILVPAIRPRTWAALTALPAAHPDAPLALALGVHPQVVPDLDADERATVDGLVDALAAAMTERVVAIGECGLDGATGDHPRQEQVLRAHVRAARALGLPLVIHVLRAHDAAPRILREERVGEVGGVVHSFSGSPELVAIYADLGLACSFAGAIARPGARRPVAAARAVAAAALLVETDAPDQAPAPGGGRNEPARLVEVIAGVARARGEAPGAVAAATAANARRVFPRAARWW